MTSPGRTSPARIPVSFPTAQLAFLTSVTAHRPSRSLARSVSPAQSGQSKRAPGLPPTGISTSCPQPPHHAFGMRRALSMSLRQTQQALQLPPIEPDDHLPVDERHGHGPVAELLDLRQRIRILADVLVREGDAFLRKELFLRLAARSLHFHQTAASRWKFPPQVSRRGPAAARRRARRVASFGTPTNSTFPLMGIAGGAITRYFTAVSGCAVMSISSR